MIDGFQGSGDFHFSSIKRALNSSGVNYAELEVNCELWGYFFVFFLGSCESSINQERFSGGKITQKEINYVELKLARLRSRFLELFIVEWIMSSFRMNGVVGNLEKRKSSKNVNFRGTIVVITDRRKWQII